MDCDLNLGMVTNQKHIYIYIYIYIYLFGLIIIIIIIIIITIIITIIIIIQSIRKGLDTIAQKPLMPYPLASGSQLALTLAEDL